MTEEKFVKIAEVYGWCSECGDQEPLDVFAKKSIIIKHKCHCGCSTVNSCPSEKFDETKKLIDEHGR